MAEEAGHAQPFRSLSDGVLFLDPSIEIITLQRGQRSSALSGAIDHVITLIDGRNADPSPTSSP
jgi:hypothetical protein